jgi:hypothetical protein
LALSTQDSANRHVNGVIECMTAIEEQQKIALDEFKLKSKESALTSFSNSLIFLLFSQWLRANFDSDQEKKQVKDQIFNDWSKQLMAATSGVFAQINVQLNQPQNRQKALINEDALSTEDYEHQYVLALKEIKENFDKTG